MSDLAAILSDIVERQRALNPNRPPLIGVAGAQGSGKTTLCRQYVRENTRIAHFSMDDIYLTKATRERLAHEVHPLFATRGPPGTHDLALAVRIIDALTVARAREKTPLPAFDKARDDRAPENEWPLFEGKPGAILIDGWCLGAAPDSLGEAPLNTLEAQDDPDGTWRRRIRSELEGAYAGFFARFDAILYLRPPNWAIVRSWRGEQEQKMLGRPLTAAEGARLDRFLMHYERITRSMMAGAGHADCIVQQDQDRRVVSISNPPKPAP